LGVTLSPQGAGGQNYHKFPYKYIFPSFTALIGDAQTTIAALNNADSGTAKGILEQLNIQDAVSDWTNLAALAQANTAYKAFIDDAAKQFGFQPSVIGGIGSRKSQWGLDLKPNGAGPAGTGDFAPRRFPTRFRTGPLPPEGGFGRGLMQIDFDAFEFARTGNWKDPAAGREYPVRLSGAG
jgi:hypothetical protein